MAGHAESPLGRLNVIELAGTGTAIMSLGGNFITMGDAKHFALGTGTGTQIGTAGSQKLAFYGATPVAQQTGVAVSAAEIHAALVNLGLITA